MSKDEKLSWDEVGEIIENTPGTYEQLILHLETVGKIPQSLSQMLQYKAIKTAAPRDTVFFKHIRTANIYLSTIYCLSLKDINCLYCLVLLL